jgi:hypothetical protein
MIGEEHLSSSIHLLKWGAFCTIYMYTGRLDARIALRLQRARALPCWNFILIFSCLV